MIELKDLTDKTIALFEVSFPEHLGDALLEACEDQEKLQAFCNLVDGDLSKDWMQMIYQYYLADRKDRKQDYTPSSIAQFMGSLAGDSEEIIDMCSGSGALLIQKWVQNPSIRVIATEYDKKVIPFLLFNMVLRNIQGLVYYDDALTDDDPVEQWRVEKGERFGKVVNIKPTI